MTPLLWALVMVSGSILIQDGIASILWYNHTETWRNHIGRVPRILIGIFLMIIGGFNV